MMFKKGPQLKLQAVLVSYLFLLNSCGFDTIPIMQSQNPIQVAAKRDSNGARESTPECTCEIQADDVGDIYTPLQQTISGNNSECDETSVICIADAHCILSQQILIDRPLTIRGSFESTQVVAQGSHRHFHIHTNNNDPVVLWNLSLSHGIAEQGGSIFIEESNVQIHNTHFTNNRARQGAAVYAQQDATLQADNLTFTDNKTPYCGDGLVDGSDGALGDFAEVCDDGNGDGNDGCSAACLVEDGWECDSEEPSNCVPIVIEGCTDESACNYNIEATLDDGACAYAQEYYDCDGNCLSDSDSDDVCDEFEIAGCTDESACNYNPAATDDDGACAYAQQYLDCDENCLNDSDGDGVCDELEITGCTNDSACNYDANATDDDGSCIILPIPSVVDCNGNCYNDSDGDGVCDENEIVGCQDSNACDYNASATEEGGCNYGPDEDGNDICDAYQPYYYPVEWNFVSLPCQVPSAAKEDVYPDSGSAYRFDGTYEAISDLVAGEGYWLHFDSPRLMSFTCDAPLEEVDIELQEGWNLIGGLSKSVDIAEVIDPEGIIVAGTLTEFGGTYSPHESTIEPGRGYWLRAHTTGIIELSHNDFPECPESATKNGGYCICDNNYIGTITWDLDNGQYLGECFSDEDGDGVSDDEDGCPADPEKQAPGQCGCGVSDSNYVIWYQDQDGDGDGDPDSTTFACSQPSGYVTNNSDSDDNCTSNWHDCNGVCDGSAQNQTYYYDGDGDGLGAGSASIYCNANVPSGYVNNNSDSDDDCTSNWHD
ncbi:MAG: hypothetical protein QGI45_04935, partial [Myxococcota bacterium]|nr:hypothetical protein [Myxococcota bacterium]